MKPENVIHYGRQIKVIDLGAVRRIDDRDTALVFTPNYAPPYRRAQRSAASTSTATSTPWAGRWTRWPPGRRRPTGLAERSFRAADRPGHARRSRRPLHLGAADVPAAVGGAQGAPGAEPARAVPGASTRFEPTAVLFGTGLGTVPTAARWTRRAVGARPPELETGRPARDGVARALPGADPRPGDGRGARPDGLSVGGTERVAGQTEDVPERVVERVRRESELRTVEVALWLCRAICGAGDAESAPEGRRLAQGGGPADGRDDRRLRLAAGLAPRPAVPDGPSDRQGPGRVRRGVRGRARRVGAQARARLLRGGPRRPPAGGAPGSTRRCGERDSTQGSAAFGLARLYLRAGRRDAAVRVLDKVPLDLAALRSGRVAAIRVLTGRLPGADRCR